ncbi:hypothetical protein CVS40_11821 [Lucilia cuprina]|nr:hypothetical protein CVS40_11821 [Lucilia cuprina]
MNDNVLVPRHPAPNLQHPEINSSSPNNARDPVNDDNVVRSPVREKDTDNEFETPQAGQNQNHPHTPHYKTAQALREETSEQLNRENSHLSSDQHIRRSKRIPKPRVLFSPDNS